jgi:hypothetical protein
MLLINLSGFTEKCLNMIEFLINIAFSVQMVECSYECMVLFRNVGMFYEFCVNIVFYCKMVDV